MQARPLRPLSPPSPARLRVSFVPADPFFCLVLSVLYHQLSGSGEHQLHLRCFPAAFDLPMFWSAEQLQQLSGCSFTLSSSYVDAETDYKIRLPQWLAAAHLPTPFPIPSFDQYRLALAAVMTRGFRDRSGLPCLIPLLDFCNTTVRGKETAYLAWEAEGEGGVVLSAGSCGLRQGQAVTIVYGEERGNSSLLERYGFVLQDNTEDSVELDLQLIADAARSTGLTLAHASQQRGSKRRRLDTEQKLQTEEEEKDGGDDEDEDDSDDVIDELVEQMAEEFFSLHLQRPLPSRLIKFAASLCQHYPAAELLQHTDRPPAEPSLPLVLKDGEIPIGKDEGKEAEQWVTSAPLQLTEEAESEVLQLLYLAMNQRLSLWPTTLQQDEGTMTELEAGLRRAGQSQEDTRRLRMALLLRLSEKRILLHHIHELRQRLSQLMQSLALREEDSGSEQDSETADTSEGDVPV